MVGCPHIRQRQDTAMVEALLRLLMTSQVFVQVVPSEDRGGQKFITYRAVLFAPCADEPYYVSGWHVADQ